MSSTCLQRGYSLTATLPITGKEYKKKSFQQNKMNRSFSIRSSKGQRSGAQNGGGAHANRSRGGFLKSLRGPLNNQPELSRRLYKLIKSENTLVGAHETAGRERISIATQLSEWGERTPDPAVADLSDKLGVILAEVGEQEDAYAHAIEDSRSMLKHIRNTERSVQPSRESRGKLVDEIARLKSKEPQSARLVILEQELVRAEAENLVAEAQLFNITRKSLKAAYEAEFLATIERAEKQIILARHGRRLLELLDEEAVVPGAAIPDYHGAADSRQIVCDCEDDLGNWRPDYCLESEQASSSTPAMSETNGTNGTNGNKNEVMPAQVPTTAAEAEQSPVTDQNGKASEVA
ncbi:hypothetical protein MCOR25_000571 [Pyricularia grisea]|nr:hypothetical protein MCOR25_000571 [Pyricularia grisea]